MAQGVPRFTYGETRMLTEYLAFQYPEARVWERMRLGPLEAVGGAEGWTEEELAMSGVFRRWADAVVLLEDELVIVEAKMRSAPDGVAQLLLYRDLAQLTPELAPYLGRPLVLELVVAVEDPAVSRLCAQQGVRQRVYRPDWLAQWSSSRHRREARPPRDFSSAGGS